MTQDKRLQVRISGWLYDKLIYESMMTGLPISQIVRLRIQGKKIFRERGENE